MKKDNCSKNDVKLAGRLFSGVKADNNNYSKIKLFSGVGTINKNYGKIKLFSGVGAINKNYGRISRKVVSLILFVSLAILFISFASAFAVTKSHSSEFPLRIMPGEEGEAWIELQNHAGQKDLAAEVRVLRGEEIIENIEEIEREAEINYGSELRIPILLKIPPRARLGDNYYVELSVIIKSRSWREDMLTFNSEIVQSIPIAVGEPPQAVENVPMLNDGTGAGEQEIEKPSRKSYENFLILLAALIGVLVVVKVLIKLNRKR